MKSSLKSLADSFRKGDFILPFFRSKIRQFLDKIEIEENTITISDDVVIRFKGNITFLSDKNVIIFSNKEEYDPNTGRNYSVYINTDPHNETLILEENDDNSKLHSITD